MSVRDVLHIGLTSRGRSTSRRLGSLWDAEHFRTLIEREICRSDRIGMGCALVVFEVEGTDGQQAYRRGVLAQVALERSRITDEVGAVREGGLGVLLAHTTPGGARRFATGVCDALIGRMPQPSYAIYVYPSGPGDDLSDEGGSAVECQPLESLLVQLPSRWKRLLDVVGASVALVLAMPLILTAVAAIRMSSPGPAIYRQRRAGLGGRPFTMYKLRTMVVGAEAQQAILRQHSEQDGPAFKMRNDPRVTPIGRLLRTTSIDELPQLWNVLKGDMSLVGPRPLPCHEAQACHRWHQRRHNVLPGLTCIWQLRGRSRVSFEEWMRMDLKYVRRQGLLHDLLLLLETIPAVLLRRGAC